MDPELKRLVEQVEKELFQEILSTMRQGRLPRSQASILAKDYLKLLPFLSKEDLLKKLFGLSELHDEAKPIYIKIAAPVDEESRTRALNQMRAHVREGYLNK